MWKKGNRKPHHYIPAKQSWQFTTIHHTHFKSLKRNNNILLHFMLYIIFIKLCYNFIKVTINKNVAKFSYFHYHILLSYFLFNINQETVFKMFIDSTIKSHILDQFSCLLLSNIKLLILLWKKFKYWSRV